MTEKVTTITPAIVIDDMLDMLCLDVRNPDIMSMTNFTSYHTNITIHNVTIDQIIVFRDKLNVVIQDHLDKLVNKAGEVPNESDCERG